MKPSVETGTIRPDPSLKIGGKFPLHILEKQVGRQDDRRKLQECGKKHDQDIRHEIGRAHS